MDHIDQTIHSNEETAFPPTSQKSLGLDPVTWAAAGAVGKWVGEKVAGGIIGAVAGKLFSEVMTAIGLGGPDLVGRLDHISNQLLQVQQSLDRLTVMTAEILKQLAELRNFMEQTVKLESLLQAVDRINEMYGKPSSRPAMLGDATESPDLRLLVEKMPHYPGITPAQLKQTASKFAAWVKDVKFSIATIHRVLTQSAYGQTPLIEYWVSELVKQVNANKLSREAAYLVLEGYFLQAVSTQLKGVSVHCVALATADFPEQNIRVYLEDDFAPMMADETAAFVRAVEFLMFSTLAPTMPVGGLQSPNGERDFPAHVDEILLRADLISAALNLVGYKPDKPSPSVQAAIQGIYGRSLVRPSDLTNGVPPPVTLQDYPAQSGKDVRATPLPCLDFTAENNRAVLKDINSTTATVAHFFWKFPAKLPAVGDLMDWRQRNGVKVGQYPVFGSENPVLAASLFDVSRLYRGIGEWLPRSYKYFKFPGQYSYIGFADEELREFGGHPITSVRGSCFEQLFTVFHTYQAETGQHTLVSHHLFKYSGAPAKVRLTARVKSKIHRDARLTSAQWWEVYHRLKLKSLTKGWEREFYNSVESYGPQKPISINGTDARAPNALYAPYDAERGGTFSIDFDLEAGEYELLFDGEAAFHHDSNGYHGWHKTMMYFVTDGIWLERVF